MSKLIKNRDGNFTHIKNDIFDSGLSAKAIGLFCYLWHLPDDWKFYEMEIMNHFKDGRYSIRSGLKELTDAGYVKRVQARHNGDGKFTNYDWELNESPMSDFPTSVNPTSEKPTSGNQTLQSTNNTKYEDNKISSSSGDDFVDEKPVNNQSFTSYEKLWRFPNAIAREDLSNWINNYSDELVNYAIEIAGRNNVTSRGAYKYLDTILTAWKKDNITTIEQAKKQNKEHNNRIDREYKSRRNYSKPVKRETIPEDWGKHDQAKPVDADEAKALKERIARLRNKGDKQ